MSEGRAWRGPTAPDSPPGKLGSLLFVLAEDPWGPKLGGSPGRLAPHKLRLARTLETGVSRKTVTCPKSSTELAVQGPGLLPLSGHSPFPVTAACLGVALGLPGGVTRRD